MIGSYSKASTEQVMSEVFNEVSKCQKLFICYAIILLCSTHSPTGISDDAFLPVLYLGEDSPDAVVAGICV